jgi:hypothetical protein
MKCLTCLEEGRKSTITPHGGSTICMGFSPYYDEEGKYHSHDPNTSSFWYSCSNGHEWGESSYRACPSCDYATEAKARMKAYHEKQEAGKKS